MSMRDYSVQRSSATKDIAVVILLVLLAATLFYARVLRADYQKSLRAKHRILLEKGVLERRVRGLKNENGALKEQLHERNEHNEKLRKYIRDLRAAIFSKGYPVRIFARRPNTANLVAITIDDGWDSKWVSSALDVLNEKNVRATFFPVGKILAARPDLWRQAVEAGHEIGNHTYDHASLSELQEAQILGEIDAHQSAFETALGRKYYIKYFRPPNMDGFRNYGGTGEIRQALAKRDIIVALWVTVQPLLRIEAFTGARAKT